MKRTVLAIGAIAVIVVGITVLSSGRISEEWYLHKLKASDEVTRNQAAAKLSRMKSKRAIPLLIDCLLRDRREEIREVYGTMHDFHSSRPATDSDWIELTPLAYSLYELGTGCVEAIDQKLKQIPSGEDHGSGVLLGVKGIIEDKNPGEHRDVRPGGYFDWGEAPALTSP